MSHDMSLLAQESRSLNRNDSSGDVCQSAHMGENQEIHRDYVRELVRITGLNPSNLALKAGLAASTLNRFLRQDRIHLLSWRTLEAIRKAAIEHVGPGKVPPLPTSPEILADALGIEVSQLHSAPRPQTAQIVDDPDECAWLKLWRALNHRQKQISLAFIAEIADKGAAARTMAA